VQLRDTRYDQPRQHVTPYRPHEYSGNQHRDEHHADAQPHDFTEQTVPAQPNKRYAGRTVKYAEHYFAADGIVEKGYNRIERNAARTHQRRAYEKRPRQQIRQETYLERPAQMRRTSLQQRFARGKLPSREPFIEHEFQACAEKNRP